MFCSPNYCKRPFPFTNTMLPPSKPVFIKDHANLDQNEVIDMSYLLFGRNYRENRSNFIKNQIIHYKALKKLA